MPAPPTQGRRRLWLLLVAAVGTALVAMVAMLAILAVIGLASSRYDCACTPPPPRPTTSTIAN